MSQYRIFLDTAELAEIKDAVSTGFVDGIATNPNKIAQSGKTYRQVLDEIRQFFEGPIAFQAMGNTTDEIIQHALEIHRMDPLLAVKVIANRNGLPAIRPLVAEGVRTNATLMFNPTQALLAGLAGSPFISPFIGRARMAGSDGIEAIRQMRQLYDAWGITQTAIIRREHQGRDAGDRRDFGRRALRGRPVRRVCRHDGTRADRTGTPAFRGRIRQGPRPRLKCAARWCKTKRFAFIEQTSRAGGAAAERLRGTRSGDSRA